MRISRPMPKPKYHVFVCQKERRREKKLLKLMLVTKTGRMGRCSTSPTTVVYPDGVWYMKVRPEDVDEIIESRLKNGKPVERLLLEKKFWD